jgi:YidC/Oxa1 family membrane protein insertase
MEKRALAAIALSILVLVAFRYFEERRTGGQPRKATPASKSAAVPAPPPADTAPARPQAPAELTAPAATGSADTKAVARPVVVDTELYRAVLDNRGGVITSWQLKPYTSARGQVYEMIPAVRESEGRVFPGSVTTDDGQIAQLVNNEPYEVTLEGSGTVPSTVPAPAVLILRLVRGDLTVEKRYRFLKENFVTEIAFSLSKGGKPVAGRMLVGQDVGPEHEHLLNPAAGLVAVSSSGKKVSREKGPGEAGQVKRVDGEVRWVGLDVQYFALIAVPAQPLAFYELQKRAVKTEGLDGKEITRDLLRVSIPTGGEGKVLFYMGPKKPSYLEAVPGADLSGGVDYGMFSIIVYPLLVSLKWIYGYVHNYGLAIILLTLLLTLLLFPFRLKQMVSMKRMAVVQPKIKEIQERYKRYKKTDPKRAEMNQEIMAVYREHNVNPLGGCLPLVLQMPLLFAFYSLLAYSIELRHAPFAAWIQDLSAKDPYYILPIVMGVTMLISQKMTPMSPGMDPTQAKMMLIMPAVFTVMFLNVSAGLNLYFLCSNIFQIFFQKVAERWVGDSRRKPVKSRA